jgi:hypothetical protein
MACRVDFAGHHTLSTESSKRVMKAADASKQINEGEGGHGDKD